MSVDLSGEITAIATAVLAIFAIVTAYYARRAFLMQSKEVSDQAEMLRVQSEQLDEQRKVNEEQARVLALQAEELRESLKERKREAGERLRAQASRVFISAQPSPEGSDPVDSLAVRIVNTSQQPIYDLIFFWRDGIGEWKQPPRPPRLPVLMPGESASPFVTSLVPSLPRESFLLDTSLLGQASSSATPPECAGASGQTDSLMRNPRPLKAAPRIARASPRSA